MLERQEMLAPVAVDGLQQHLLLDGAHRLGAVAGDLRRHELVGLLHQALADRLLVDALLVGPLRDRQVDAEIVLDLALQLLGLPLVGIGLLGDVLGDEVLDQLVAHVARRLGEILGLHDLPALAEDRLALVVHHVVELQQVLADLEVARLDLALGALQRLVHPGVDDRLAFLHAELAEHRVEPVGPEDPHQVVLEREEEQRAAGVALPAGAAAELVVDAPALVALGAEHEEAARLERPRLGLGDLGLDAGADLRRVDVAAGRLGLLDLLDHPHLDVAAELDVGAAPGHVRRDGHRARHAGIGDDLRLLLVVAGVQDVVGILRALSIAERFSDFSIEVVPTRIGCPAPWARSISATMASYFSCGVR
jgi:hypothetical protein